MLSINIEDVYKVLNLCKPYLIGLGIVLAVALIVIIACMKVKNKAQKYMIRSQAGIAMLVAFVLVVNLLCFGPLNTLITLATGNGEISEESNARSP